MPDLSELLDLLLDDDAPPPPSSTSMVLACAPRLMLVQVAMSSTPKAVRVPTDAPEVRQRTHQIKRQVNITKHIHKVFLFLFQKLKISNRISTYMDTYTHE